MRLFMFINLIINYMIILFILYLNFCYNNNKTFFYNIQIFKFSKKIFLLFLLYIKTFYELCIIQNNSLICNNNCKEDKYEEITPPIVQELEGEKEIIIDEYIINNELETIDEYIIVPDKNEINISSENDSIDHYLIEPVLDINITDEEISIDNIHFGSFIDSLEIIEEETRPVLKEQKEVKKIKIGKNKKITTELVLN